MPADSYSYRGWDGSGGEVTGEVVAANVQDALRKARERGHLVQAIRKGNTPPEKPEPGEAGNVVNGPARRNINLALMQSVGDGADEVALSFSGGDVQVTRLILGNWYPLLPLSGEGANEALGALRDMSGEASLGAATVRTQRTVNLHVDLPDWSPEPYEVPLEFHSDESEPGRVGITILEPKEPRLYCERPDDGEHRSAK